MDREERWLLSQNSWWMALLDMFYLAKRGNIFMYNHLLTLFLKELFLDAQKPSCVKRFAYWSWLQPKNKNKLKKKKDLVLRCSIKLQHLVSELELVCEFKVKPKQID